MTLSGLAQNLIQKFLNNPKLAIFMLVTIASLLVIASQLFIKHITNKKLAFVWLAGLIGISTLTFYTSWPVFFWPDLFIGLFFIWALVNLRQTISWQIWLSILLLIYFFCFSPPRMDIEFDNRYLVPMKPFIYLIILYLCSGTKVRWDIQSMAYAWIIFYPLLLLWDVFLSWLGNGYFMTRPNFIFENNFEVPFLLFCFIITSFIYKNKDIRIYLLVAIAVLLTGSRSGLAGFLVVSVFYFFSLDRKKMLIVLALVGSLLAYILAIRGSSAFNASNLNSIDRLQNFYRIFSLYDYSFVEVLKHPLGFGIYQKVPPGICEQSKEYAEWVTGNFYNCDPIMLQSFLARGLFQYGIYVVLFIAFAFFWELRKRMGTYLALLTVSPIVCASFSVGGFSNGLAFGGLLLCLLAYQQSQGQQSKVHPSFGKLT
jgi:hypothetical protein